VSRAPDRTEKRRRPVAPAPRALETHPVGPALEPFKPLRLGPDDRRRQPGRIGRGRATGAPCASRNGEVDVSHAQAIPSTRRFTSRRDGKIIGLLWLFALPPSSPRWTMS
jgi:hypothetical protein